MNRGSEQNRLWDYWYWCPFCKNTLKIFRDKVTLMVFRYVMNIKIATLCLQWNMEMLTVCLWVMNVRKHEKVERKAKNFFSSRAETFGKEDGLRGCAQIPRKFKVREWRGWICQRRRVERRWRVMYGSVRVRVYSLVSEGAFQSHWVSVYSGAINHRTRRLYL